MHELIQVVWWVGAAIAFCGTFAVSMMMEVRLGHALWIVSNAIICGCSVYFGAYPMAFLFAAYFLMSICGLIKWKKKQETKEPLEI